MRPIFAFLALAVLAMSALAMSAFPAVAAQLKVQKVVDNVYAIVGPLGQRNPGNLGNNATFGLVVTGEGAVVIDAGGSYLGARKLHDAVRSVTDQPVRMVINTGGQDHRWLGNGYWKDQGARIIASAAAVADQQDRASLQLTMLADRVTEMLLQGTEPVFADETFEDDLAFSLGGVRFELTHAPAHTPGDAFVWLPGQSVMFAGDIVFTQRMLGVLPVSSTADWVQSFERMAAHAPAHVVPGHGAPTDLGTAELDSYDYLVHLRGQIAALIEDGGDIMDAPAIDQSAFSHLRNFDTLAGRNAQEVFSQMEWE